MTPSVLADPAVPLTEAQVEQLQLRLRGMVFNLRVTVCSKGLILQGQSRTYYAKQMAQHLAMSSLSVRIASNEIVVVESPITSRKR
jgi:hypothetical protein